jgi:predicted transcriptional regulator
MPLALSKRQGEVQELTNKGYSRKQIARELGISSSRVGQVLKDISDKQERYERFEALGIDPHTVLTDTERRRVELLLERSTLSSPYTNLEIEWPPDMASRLQVLFSTPDNMLLVCPGIGRKALKALRKLQCSHKREEDI